MVYQQTNTALTVTQGTKGKVDYNMFSRLFTQSKTGRKGVSPPGVRFSLRRLHVGEVFPWYTCMPTLGARPHSTCGVRRAQAPVMSTTWHLP